MLKDAVAKGVNFNVVNIMTMDYGSPQSNMGQDAISGANGLHTQLQQIFPAKTSSQIWGMVGITPDLGQNDSAGEIFSLSNASQVLTFAQQNQIGELSFWAVSRDNGSCPGSTGSSDTCDGLSQASYAFTNLWKVFSSGASAPGTTPTAVPTTPSGSVPVAGQAYNVINKNSGKALDVKDQSTVNGGGIQQWSLVVGQANQQWTFISTGSGSYYIMSKSSGKVLDDTGWSTTAGTPVQQWSEVSGQTDQQWSLVSAGSGFYYIKNVFSGDVLDVTGQSTADGALVQQWTQVTGQANQEWSLQTA
jgi:chitinase